LDSAIESLINLGEKDPLVIARKLKKRYGNDWVVAELMARDEEILAEMARLRLGNLRRSAVKSVSITHAPKQRSELMIASMWVPNVGWKKVGDLTPEDLRKRAHFHMALSLRNEQIAQWCNECADEIEKEGVQTMGDLHVIPSLPDAHLPEIGAAS
jgi:hypothetical protein